MFNSSSIFPEVSFKRKISDIDHRINGRCRDTEIFSKGTYRYETHGYIFENVPIGETNGCGYSLITFIVMDGVVQIDTLDIVAKSSHSKAVIGSAPSARVI